MEYIKYVIIGLLIIANILIIIRVIKTGKFGTITLFEKGVETAEVKTPFTVLHSIKQLLDYTPPGEVGGFVIFEVGPCQYVQYALSEEGMLLYWPTSMEGGPEHLPILANYLNEIGFVQIDPPGSAVGMPAKHYFTCEDGLYAQCGRDPLELEKITLGLLHRCFGVSDQRVIAVTLELDG